MDKLYIHLQLQSIWTSRFVQEQKWHLYIYLWTGWCIWRSWAGWWLKMPFFGMFPIHIALRMKLSSISILSWFPVLTMACASWTGFHATFSRNCFVSGGDSLPLLLSRHDHIPCKEYDATISSNTIVKFDQNKRYDILWFSLQVYCDPIWYNTNYYMFMKCDIK